LRFKLWAGSHGAAARSSVGYIVERADRTYGNATIRFSEAQWDGDTERTLRVSLPVGASALRVTLLLRLGPYVVDTRQVLQSGRMPSTAYLSAYEVFDHGLQHLRGALLTTEAQVKESKDRDRDIGAKTLEHAVARLFSIAGFHTDALDGYSGLSDAPDVLAYHPDGTSVLVIECTVGPMATKRGKPSRLLERVQELRQRPELAKSALLPVMVFGRAGNLVHKGDRAHVAHDGVAILAQEDLMALLEKVRSGATASDVLDFCHRSVPPTPGDGGRAETTYRRWL
jgi:hypothetical protein